MTYLLALLEFGQTLGHDPVLIGQLWLREHEVGICGGFSGDELGAGVVDVSIHGVGVDIAVSASAGGNATPGIGNVSALSIVPVLHTQLLPNADVAVADFLALDGIEVVADPGLVLVSGPFLKCRDWSY